MQVKDVHSQGLPAHSPAYAHEQCVVSALIFEVPARIAGTRGH